MTYQELADFILRKLNDEQRAMDLIVYDSRIDEFFPAHLSIIEESNGILDDNHPYFVF